MYFLWLGVDCGFVGAQEKLEKRLEDTQYGLESRILKLEELLADSRNYITDVQTVSNAAVVDYLSSYQGC